MIQPHEKFMREAIAQAVQAKEEGDYAIGAVLAIGNDVISAWGSRVRRDESPIAHAEILAILDAAQKLKSRHLTNAILYVTHEPCPMCTGAAVFARLKGIVYGARIADMEKYAKSNEHGVYLWKTIDIPAAEVVAKSHEPFEVVKDFMRDECIALFNGNGGDGRGDKTQDEVLEIE